MITLNVNGQNTPNRGQTLPGCRIGRFKHMSSTTNLNIKAKIKG
jgi:hypothetical protein